MAQNPTLDIDREGLLDTIRETIPAQRSKQDIAREWLLDAIQETPAIIEGMSEPDLDQALSLLEINVDPTVALVRANSAALPKEAEDALHSLDQIQACDLDNLSEAELDKTLAALGIDIAPTVQLVSDHTSVPTLDSHSPNDPVGLDVGLITPPGLVTFSPELSLAEPLHKPLVFVNAGTEFDATAIEALRRAGVTVLVGTNTKSPTAAETACGGGSTALHMQCCRPELSQQHCGWDFICTKAIECWRAEMPQPRCYYSVPECLPDGSPFSTKASWQPNYFSTMRTELDHQPASAAIVHALCGIDRAQLANSVGLDGDLSIAVTESVAALAADFKVAGRGEGRYARRSLPRRAVIAFVLLDVFSRHMCDNFRTVSLEAIGERVNGGRYLDPVHNIYSAVHRRWLSAAKLALAKSLVDQQVLARARMAKTLVEACKLAEASLKQTETAMAPLTTDRLVLVRDDPVMKLRLSSV